MLVYPADLSSRGFSTEVRFCLHYKKNLLEYRHSDFTLRFPKVSIFEGDGLMDEMVFATFLILLSDAWDEVISEVNLVELLYDGVADAANLRTEDGQVICVTKGTASKVFARQTGGNVRRDIRKHASDPKVITSIEEYFKKKVLTHILPARKPDLIGGLKKVIEKELFPAGVETRPDLKLDGARDTRLAQSQCPHDISGVNPEAVGQRTVTRPPCIGTCREDGYVHLAMALARERHDVISAPAAGNDIPQ